jgi:hypothetical protein
MSPTANTQTTPAPVATPAPTPSHHFNLLAFLRILEIMAPAIAAPFVPAKTEQIIQQEAATIGQVTDAAMSPQQ